MAGAGYKLFNTGDVLTAAQVNTYLQEQAVMRFANATARTTALSGVLAQGMVSYLDDTKVVQVYNGTSWVNVGGSSPLTTKGDLYTYSTADARLAMGTNGQYLTADSTAATGLKWSTLGYPTNIGCTAFIQSANVVYGAGTNTVLSFTNEDYDTDNFHSNVTNTSRLTIPTGLGGKYLVNTIFRINSGFSYAIVQVLKNGAGTNNGIDGGQIVRNMNLGSNSFNLNASEILTLAAGDYIEMVPIVDVGGTYATFARFSLTYLGA